jgi:hypothetical protein
MRPIPHGRQAGRTVGGDWLRQGPGYHTGGYCKRGRLTWLCRQSLTSSRGRRLELRPNSDPGGTGTSAFCSPSLPPLTGTPVEPPGSFPATAGRQSAGASSAGSVVASLPGSWHGPQPTLPKPSHCPGLPCRQCGYGLSMPPPTISVYD